MHTSSLSIHLLLIMVNLLSCAKKNEQGGTEATPLVSVKLSTIHTGTMEQKETLLGKSDIRLRQRVISPITGRLIYLKGAPGTKVTSGEIVAVIRTGEADAAIEGARTLLRQANTPEQKAEARRMLNLALKTQNSVTLRASFNGVIASLSVDIKQDVSASGEIMEIVDLSTFDFVAAVPLTKLGSLHTGLEGVVRFAPLPEESFPVTIALIEPQADSQSQHVNVRMHFSNTTLAMVDPQFLKAEIPGTAIIITGTHTGVLLAPNAALLRNDENNTYSIVTITADSLSRIVSITIGTSNDSLTEITSNNVHAGMPVITSGNYGLTDSTRITTSSQVK